MSAISIEVVGQWLEGRSWSVVHQKSAEFHADAKTPERVVPEV